MRCEKCNNESMVNTSVFRLSGCLVTLGFILLIPAAITLAFTILLTVLGVYATGTAASEMTNKLVMETEEELQELRVPQHVIADFKDDHSISEKTLNTLSSDQRRQVEITMDTYNAVAAGAAIGTGGIAIFGGGFVVALFVLSIPALIIGFLLILRKKVCKCPNCGYFFERA